LALSPPLDNGVKRLIESFVYKLVCILLPPVKVCLVRLTLESIKLGPAKLPRLLATDSLFGLLAVGLFDGLLYLLLVALGLL
jgi:hypothetical protein